LQLLDELSLPGQMQLQQGRMLASLLKPILELVLLACDIQLLERKL
jgi:hypothetical protein